MPKSRIPSPARSQSALVTPRRSLPRGPRSVGSPARSNTSVRLTSVIQNFKDKNMDSFHLSPLNSRRSVLNDNTDIEGPGRHSWWRKLNDTSRDILEVLDNEKQDGAFDVMEEYMEDEVLSQEKKDKQALDRPDSSDSESISSIIIPQRKLFTQKENQPNNKFAKFLSTRESMAKHNKTNTESEKEEKSIVVSPKKFFGGSSKPRSKPAFPAELLKFSPDKTVNKTAGEVKGQVRTLFGNRAGVKRKNKFADFIASESEDEPEIQPKVFGFQKKRDAPSRRVSTASSLTTDIDMEDWKLLPSSTMVQTQLEAMIADSPVKKARLDKLSEVKESETVTNSTATTNKSKQSNKSGLSKNKSKLSTSKNSSNKSKTPPEVNNEVENIINDEIVQPEVVEFQGKVANTEQKGKNATINKSKESNKSPSSNNKSKMNNSNKTLHKSIVNEVPDIDDQNLELDVDDMPKDTENVVENSDKSRKSKSTTAKNKTSFNKSKTSPNKSVSQSILKEAIPENKDQEIEPHFDVEDGDVVADIHTDLYRVDNVEEKDEGQIDVSNINKEYNKSVTTFNKTKISNVKHSFNKSKTSPKVNENHDMDVSEDKRKDEEPNKDPDDDNLNMIIMTNKSTIPDSNRTLNKSKMGPNVNTNDNLKSILNEAVPEEDEEMEVDDNEENIIPLTYSDEEAIEQEKEILSENVAGDDKVDSDAVDNSQEVRDKNIVNDEKNINKTADLNDSEEEKEENEEEGPEIQNETYVSDDEKPESEVDEVEDGEEIQEMDEKDEIEIDDPAETEEDNEVIGENASQEVVTEDEDSEENEDNDVEDENEEEIELEEDESHQDQSQEIEESREEENEEAEASEVEENESQEITNERIGDGQNKVVDESEDQNDERTNAENQDISITEETPNVTHDTTGRHRKKNETNVKSPEAVLKNDVDLAESFTAKGRNTSIRRTSMLKSLNIRPSLAPPRESTGLTNSSAEGSGWDSHRTTRKTLRQTFGRDFTPRKSLRALVMEKSAKRHTVYNDMNDVDMPRANSTELPEASNREEDTMEDPHEISKRTRQTTLEMYLQKIKKQNMEKKKKLEEEVRSSLTAPSKDVLNPFKVPSRPFVLKRVTKPAQNKPKTKAIKSTIPIENLPQDLLEDMKYRPPKRFQPSNASWITKRLYKFLETKLEPKYDYKARVRAEKLVETIYNFVKDLRRVDVASDGAVEVLKREMARLSVVNTHFEFYQFFHDYLPREVRVKVVPDVVNKIPLPRHGVFTEILRGNTVQG